MSPRLKRVASWRPKKSSLRRVRNNILIKHARSAIQMDKHEYDTVYNQIVHFQADELVQLEQVCNRIKGPDESYLAFFGATKAGLRHTSWARRVRIRFVLTGSACTRLRLLWMHRSKTMLVGSGQSLTSWSSHLGCPRVLEV